MCPKRLVVGLVLAVLAAAGTVAAQVASPVEVWGESGVGFGGAGAGPNTRAGGNVSVRAAVHVRRGRLALTARGTATSGGRNPDGSLFWEGSHDGFYDVGLLAGYAVPLGGAWEAQASAGIARVWGSRSVQNTCGFMGCGFGNGVTSAAFDPVVGLPLEVGVYRLVAERRLGIGLTAYANVNPEEVFGGALVSVRVRPF